ncbi:MAG TPA: hypothetical protein VMN82_11350 [Thermoanaerobaculia bacterium]|nr:hypothetical protein [Thermoanaerobaculia bacterium]
MNSESPPDPLDGIRVSSHRVERAAARAREAAHTFSAWVLRVETDRGPGAIARVEPTPDEAYWRGDGVFLGWTAGRLAAAWDAIRATEPAPEAVPDLPQLG